jgi:uncharacterized protein (TIGR00297 family)
VPPIRLQWQSKLVLLLVLPIAGVELVLQTQWWATQYSAVAIWTLGLSLLLALVVLKLRAATPAGAATGAAVTASLMFSTVSFPYEPWHTALPPVLAVSLLAWIATKLGRAQKEKLGTAEARRGRSAFQIAANLGAAALASNQIVQTWMTDALPASRIAHAPALVFALGLAALAEAAADTVSSEIGQVLGGRPRMITTLRIANPGADGAISALGTAAGIAAAAIVSSIGAWALRGNFSLFCIAFASAIFGLFFDSLLGATMERKGWINNDAVNFLSTCAAAGVAFALVAFLPA